MTPSHLLNHLHTILQKYNTLHLLALPNTKSCHSLKLIHTFASNYQQDDTNSNIQREILLKSAVCLQTFKELWPLLANCFGSSAHKLFSHINAK